jgi:hypothetical protein
VNPVKDSLIGQILSHVSQSCRSGLPGPAATVLPAVSRKNDKKRRKVMAFPGTIFFLVLAVLQFFIIADGLVAWFRIDWLVAVHCAALLSGIPLFASFRLLQHRRS